MTEPARFRHRTTALLLGALLLFITAAPTHADDKPGAFDYYVLALSWSPTWCEAEESRRTSPQCSGTRPYAFVLHGLWPQYAKGWPKFCDIGRKPWVPRKMIDAMLDIMPARGLVIHQYKKHGTCSGLTPEAYFALSRRLFEGITIPERYRGPDRHLQVTPREVEADFLTANPDLRANMISIACGRQRRLREVRICFSREGALAPCGVNEDQAKLCRLDKVVLPPVRGR